MARDEATDAGRRLIGPHLPLASGLLRAAERARQIGATAMQIFTDNPTAWRRRSELPAEVDEFRRRLAEAAVGPLAVHAPYLVNLCGPNETFWSQSVATMANELRVGARYGASFVVMHIGSHGGAGREHGIRRLVEGIAAVLDAAALHRTALDGAVPEPVDASLLPRLVLENAAGMGDGIGASIEDLADILTAAESAGLALDRLGVCLDTAHLWGAGYDVASETGVHRLVERVDTLLGRSNVVMVHLNDSRTVLGSRLDRHEHIAAGQLGVQGIRGVLDHPWLATLPTYLETPGMDSGYDEINLERVRLLIAGETPPRLPAEAFTVRSSRERSGPPKA